MASCRVIGQTSSASGSLVVRGLATLGICIVKLLLRNSACLTSLSSKRRRTHGVMGDRLGLVDVGKPLATGGEHPGRQHGRLSPPVPA